MAVVAQVETVVEKRRTSAVEEDGHTALRQFPMLTYCHRSFACPVETAAPMAPPDVTS